MDVSIGGDSPTLITVQKSQPKMNMFSTLSTLNFLLFFFFFFLSKQQGAANASNQGHD
jgi:hypothetical protein